MIIPANQKLRYLLKYDDLSLSEIAKNILDDLTYSNNFDYFFQRCVIFDARNSLSLLREVNKEKYDKAVLTASQDLKNQRPDFFK